MSIEAEVIEAVRERLEDERAEAKLNQRLSQRRGSHSDEDYNMGREAAFDFALQIIKTEMGRRGLK